ncbi:hypothetical protein Tco_0909450 [Tanacetum coccineum]|uniref:Uncharacterized protein n=1 Tax=Tanacetum coccineum TaxID=301880 RepID=A0ABQ5CQ02_9ASTR
MEANVNSNYNLYLDISRIFNNAGMNNNETIQDEPKLMGDDDDDIGYLEDYLIQKDPPDYVNEEEERSQYGVSWFMDMAYRLPVQFYVSYCFLTDEYPESCMYPDAFITHILVHIRKMEDHTEQISEEFSGLIL